MSDNHTPKKPPMTDKKKYALLTLAAVLLSGAYLVGRSIDINPTYDNKAIAQPTDHADNTPKPEIINPENLKLFPSDQIMGDISKNPTVRIIEYASLTCPHCAMFHHDSVGVIKNDYINSKKIQYIFRDYPLDGAAFKASLLAKCDMSKRQAFIDLLFKKQSEWTKARTIEEIEKNLVMFGKVGGLSEEKITKCFNDKNLSTEILSVQKDSNTLLNIQATPTILINNQMFTGGIKAEQFKKILDAELLDYELEGGKQEIPAQTICEKFVKQQLLSPASADFPWLDVNRIYRSKGFYEIKSYVDSQNVFGAMLRQHFYCKVRYLGGEEVDINNWKLIDLKFMQ